MPVETHEAWLWGFSNLQSLMFGACRPMVWASRGATCQEVPLFYTIRTFFGIRRAVRGDDLFFAVFPSLCQ